MSVTDRAGMVAGVCNCQTDSLARSSYTEMQQPSDVEAAQTGIR